MATTLEKRVAALERQLADLHRRQIAGGTTGREWVEDLYGAFANDPVFEKAMKLGRQYRKSTRVVRKRKLGK